MKYSIWLVQILYLIGFQKISSLFAERADTFSRHDPTLRVKSSHSMKRNRIVLLRANQEEQWKKTMRSK